MALAWDASTSAGVVGYRVYVGIRSGTYLTSFDIPAQTSFVYDRALAGLRYYFAVAARHTTGYVSALSNEVSGIAEAGLAIESSDLSAQEEPTTVAEAPSATTDSQCDTTGCPGVTIMAQGAGSVTALTPTPDGRLLYVENDRRVRIAHAPGEPPQTALEVAHGGAALRGLALASDFARSGVVFVGEVATDGDGTAALQIVRYREVDGAFRERTLRVAGLPASPELVAPMAVDADANVFVALPSPGGSAGALLAFNAEGGSRPADGADGPSIAPAGRTTAGLFWDAYTDRLWMASLDWQSLTNIDLTGDRPPAPVAEVALPFPPASAAFARHGALISVVATSDERRLYRGVLDDAGRLGILEELVLPPLGHPVAVAVSERHDIYVALQDGDRWAIVRLER